MDGHASSKYHADAVEAALTFNQLTEQPHLNIGARLDLELVNVIQENRHVINCAQCILYCGMQCIALRGDNERIDQPGNPGNFFSNAKTNSKL